METMTALLAVDETDRYKEIIKQNLTEPVADTDSAELKTNKSLFQGEDTIVSLLPNRLNRATALELTPEMHAGLLSALAKDLTNQTAKQRLFPETPAVGAIVFVMSGENPKEQYQYIPDIYIPDIASVPLMQSLTGYGTASIIVTKDMTSTLEFMEANDLMNLFENQPGTEFIAAQIISASRLSNNYYYGGPEMSLHFLGGWAKDLNDYGSFGGADKITDNQLAGEIAANAHLSYFNSVDGYFVKFEIANSGGYTSLYVPAEKMPQSIKDAVASFVQVRPEFPMEKYMY